MPSKPLPIVLAALLSVCAGCRAASTPPMTTDYPGQSVWRAEGPDFGTGDVSQDGRYFSDINWDTGDLDIVDLESGTVRPLTGEGYDTGRNAWSSSFSSDGSRLAVAWYEYETGTHALRVHSFDGSTSTLLVPPTPETYYIEPLDWTPDDRAVVIAIGGPERDWEIGLVTVEDGSIRILRRLEWEAPGGGHPQASPRARVSPAGDLLAFDYPSQAPGHGQDVYFLALADATMRVVVEGPGNDRFAAWLPGGDGLLFYSDRSGRPALWRQALAGGAPSGPPSIVAEHILGIAPIAMTDRGFAYGAPDGSWNTYLASIDLETGDLTAGPVPVDREPWHRNSLGDWAPDGSTLMYISFGALPDPTEYAVFVSPSGEELNRVPFPHEWHNKTGKVSWIEDDFVLVDGDLKGRSHLHRFHPLTGEVSRLPDYGEQGMFVLTEASPDGSELYVVVPEDGPTVVAIDTRSGARRVIADVGLNMASLSVSPAGDELAYLTAPTSELPPVIEIMALATGERRRVPAEVNGRLDQPVAWTPGGERLLVGVGRGPGESGLLSLDADGLRPPVFIALPDAVGNFLRIAPGGEHVAFQGGIAYGSLFFLAEF